MSDNVFNKSDAIVKIDCIESLNFAMQQNDIGIIKSVTITNCSGKDMENISLRIHSNPTFFDDIYLTHSDLASGASQRFIKLNAILNFDFLSSLTEKINADIIVDVEIDDTHINSYSQKLSLLAYDEWSGCGTLPELIASFSLPSDPEVKAIVSQASQLLKSENLCFDGYQSKNPNIVNKQLAAIFSVIKSKNIAYSMPPASFERRGQKIRLPKTIMDLGLATCLDTTMLFCSCAEAVGINPIVFIMDSHAFPAFWLVDSRFSESVNDDLSEVKKRQVGGISQICTLESTFVTNKSSDYSRACQEAKSRIENASGFTMYIDIARAREAGVMPLPLNYGEEYKVDRVLYEAEKQKLEKLRVVDADLLSGNTGDRFDKWKRDLLDISLRNPLINYKPNKSGVPLLHSDMESVEDAFASGESLHILARPKEMSGNIDITKPHEALSGILKSDLSSKKLRSTLSNDELTKKLTEIFRASKLSLEESGANILYMAVGFLKWQEAEKPNVDRFTPIILLPLSIERKSIQAGYNVRMTDDGARINLSMIEMLKTNFKIDASALMALPEGETGVDVLKILTFLRQLIMQQKGWDIVDAASIGLFKYSSFMLWNDLNSREQIIRSHPLTSSLIGMQNNPSLYEAKYDSPSPLFLPLDSDSSQTSAVIAASRGETFVLHGPPGTGKSQTITNIIANALAHGKRVLFVAEKSAALNVVKRRLDKLGLFDFCLELHSDKSNRKSFYEQFDAVLEMSERAKDVNFDEAEQKLMQSAEEIEEFNIAMQKKRDIGFSVYEGINMLIEADEPEGELIDIAKTNISAKEYIEGLEAFKKTVDIGASFGDPVNSPFYKTNATDFNIKLREDVKTACKNILQAFSTYTESINLAIGELNGQSFGKKDEANNLYNCLSAVIKHNKKSAISKFFGAISQKAFKDVKKIAGFRKIKSLAKKKPDLAEEILSGIEPFISCEKTLNGLLKYGDCFNNSDEWAFEIYHASEQFEQNLFALRDYCIYNECRFKCAQYGQLDEIVKLYHEGKTDSLDALKLFNKSFLSCYLTQAVITDSVLSSFSQNEYATKREQYIKMARFVSSLTQKEIYLRMASQLPNFKFAATSSSEPGILFKAVRSKGRGMSIRQLFEKTMTLMPKIKPCMLMSPLSVAQFLPSDYPSFDLVIFDEASQMLTCEAVGAITRGDSAVIVGDPNQLPPTTFFASQQKDEDEDIQDMDMESILDDMLTLSIKQSRLLWHYRSEHESLISFANAFNYSNKLITFPSIDDNVSRVSFRKVEGFYDRGTSRTNPKEAEAVVDELFESLKDPVRSSLSYGIVTFNMTQQNLIQDLIDKRLAKEPSLEQYFRGENAAFVKNIESVQGDERDVIIFSITYGFDKDGKMLMNFGPVNKSGGWRRLNVAITRACKEMIVFSTITHDKIDVSKTSARGVHALKDFMAFAQNGGIYYNNKSVNASKKPLIMDITQSLKELGYNTIANLGNSENKIDIAVLDDDGNYKLGIIVNGESAVKNSDIRDREYGKESVLRRMGWNITRLYALEWWQDKENELKRIKHILENGLQENDESENSSVDEFISSHTEISFNSQIPVPQIDYVNAEIDSFAYENFYQPKSANKIVEQIISIVKIEAPISEQNLLKKIAQGWQVPKMTQKFNEYMSALIKRAQLVSNKTQNVTFLWNTRQEQDMNLFRSNDIVQRKAEDICKEEFAAAAYYIMENALSIDSEDLIRETAKLFGFIKSPSTAAKISFAISLLTAQNKIKKDGTICKLV